MADKKPARSKKEIEADIEATRARLAGTVDELAYRVSPAYLKSEAKAGAQAKVNTLMGDARGKVVAEDGQPRYENIAVGLGGIGAVALTLGLLRRAFNKS